MILKCAKYFVRVETVQYDLQNYSKFSYSIWHPYDVFHLSFLIFILSRREHLEYSIPLDASYNVYVRNTLAV